MPAVASDVTASVTLEARDMLNHFLLSQITYINSELQRIQQLARQHSKNTMR